MIDQTNTITVGSDGTVTSGSTFDPTCPTCQNLSDLLQCPKWNEYMGDFQNTFTAAMNAADWGTISGIYRDTMIPAMDTMLGHPSAPPTVTAPVAPTLNNITDLQRPNAPVDTTPAVTQDINFDNVQPVPVEQDTTGGISTATADPTETIEHNTIDYVPKPGAASGLTINKPIQQESPAPIPTSGDVPTTDPEPIPATGAATPPSDPTPKPQLQPTDLTVTQPAPVLPMDSTTPTPTPTMPMP